MSYHGTFPEQLILKKGTKYNLSRELKKENMKVLTYVKLGLPYVPSTLV